MKPPAIKRPERLIGLGIFALALVLRASYLAEIKNQPAFSVLTADAEAYHDWALKIAAGNWLGNEVFYQAPLYPYFLGVTYAVWAPDVFAVRLVQIVLGAASCVLLYQAGRRFFSPAAGVVAGVLLAVYPTAIFFDCLIQKSVLDLFFITLLLALVGRLLERASGPVWLLAGAALGCLALTRENALAFFVVIVVWLFVHFRSESLARRWRWSAAFCLGLALVLFPVALRNKIVGGEFHLTTSQFGSNFYIGNNEHADGGYMPLRFGRGSAEFERLDATELAEAALDRRLSPAEVSRYWADKAWGFVRAEPGRWLRLMAKKWVLVWNALEITDSEDQYTYSSWSVLLSALGRVLHFGVICPLAVAGVCVTWHQRSRLWLLYAMILTYAGAVTIFYIVARYRYPLLPMLVLFTAAALTEGSMQIRTRNWRKLLVGVAVAVPVAVATNWPLMSREPQRASTYYNLGVALAKQGNVDAAIRSYEQAIRFAPSLGVAHYNLAVLLTQQGRLEDAGARFKSALQIRADWPEARNNFASILVIQGRSREAIVHYREALRLRPDWPEPLVSLAWILATSPDPTLRNAAEAIQLAERACELTDNDQPDALDALAAAYAEAGRFEDAVRTAQKANKLAVDRGQTELAGRIQARIALYNAGQPFRQPQ